GASARLHSRIAGHGESVLVLAALRSVRGAKSWHATAGRRSLHRRERHQFVRRTRCAFYQGWRKGTCASQHSGGISIHSAGGNYRSVALRKSNTDLAGVPLSKLSDTAVMTVLQLLPTFLKNL